MRRAHLGQHIREYGPKIHEYKRGTPTMGGAVVLLVFVVLIVGSYTAGVSLKSVLVLFATLGYGAIGLVDDLLSLSRGRSLGLGVRQKFVLQIAVAALFFLGLRLDLFLSRPVLVPFVDVELVLSPYLYLGLVILVLLSTTNGMNLTDGLDGLAAGTSIIILSVYAMFVYLQGEIDLLGPIIVMVSILLGFLWFNFHPAQVFLGDTGSFALGGFVGALAILTGTELLLLVVGGVLVVETLSVIVQVMSYKLFGKRVFKVSPLHHHFERAEGVDYPYLLPNFEWSESQIVVRFWILGMAFGLIAIFAY